MSKRELKDLSTKVLKKRQRFAGLIIGINIGLSMILIIMALTKPNYNLLAIVPAILITILPMYLGLKKVKLELKNRESKEDISS